MSSHALLSMLYSPVGQYLHIFPILYSDQGSISICLSAIFAIFYSLELSFYADDNKSNTGFTAFKGPAFGLKVFEFMKPKAASP